VYQLLLFFHVRPATRPTITGVAVCHENFGLSCRVIKGGSKTVPEDTMKAYRGSIGTAPINLNLGARCRSVVNFTPRTPYLRERTAVPTKKI
jgi:hypothetical protein